MPNQAVSIAIITVMVAVIRYAIVDPAVRFLHRKGVLKGPINPNFFSFCIRWRNIWIFLAFCASWEGVILALPLLGR